MSPRGDRLLDVAASISDARAVNWDNIESSSKDKEEESLVRALRLVADVAGAHRSFHEHSGDETAPGPPRERIPSETPKRWGHLEILEIVGEGTFAEVFRARDTILDREVALKLYRPRRYVRSSDPKSILKEGRLLARVRHPNVVTVHGADERDGRVGLWMEFVRGQTLTQLVHGRGSLGAREAAVIGIDVCRALAAIHSAGLLHRDVKAQNVMREEGGRILLLDLGFGSDQITEESTEERLAGTPYYMAPELFRLESASVRSDLYAVGVLLFFLTTGTFPAVDRKALTRRDRPTDRARTLRDVRPELPDSFVTVVEEAVSENPAHRFPSAGEMATALSNSIAFETKQPVTQRFRLAFAAALVIAVVLAVMFVPGPGPPIAENTLAVLPFENRSEDPGLDFLSAGIGHGIISRLSQLEQLHKVVSGTSVEKYRETDIDPANIGQELGVEALLTGHMEVIDAKIVVYVELVDAAQNRSLWGKRFVRQREDILDVEEQFAKEIAGALGLEMSGKEATQLTKRYTSDPRAYELYQMGRFFWEKRTKETLKKAIGLFEQAIELDPRYAKAYAGLADAFALLDTGYFASDESTSDALVRARTAAETALRFDEYLPEAHASLGLLFVIGNRPEDAEAHYARAIALSPNLVTARQWYSRLLSNAGEHDKAIVHAERAVELDPISPAQHRNLGFAHYDARHYAEAIGHFQRTLELDPDFPFARDSLSLCYWYLDQRARAVANLKDTDWKARFFHMVDTQQSEKAILLLERESSSLPEWMLPLYYMLAGEQETALVQLERLVEAGTENVDITLREKAFDGLVHEERFLRLLERASMTWREGVGSLKSSRS